MLATVVLPLVATWTAGSLLLVALAGQDAVPYEDLLLDPNATGRLPWYTGLISSLGVLGWTVAAVAAAAGAWISGQGGREQARQCLGGGALLSVLLLVDDLFQLHVVVSLGLGLSKVWFYGLYLLLGSWWLAHGRREIRRTRWPLLAAAAVALAGSVGVDQLVPPSLPALVAEDSCKFLGILAWGLYFVCTGRDIARSTLASSTLASSTMSRSETMSRSDLSPPREALYRRR
jgi:hypothetical protein